MLFPTTSAVIGNVMNRFLREHSWLTTEFTTLETVPLFTQKVSPTVCIKIPDA
ncbi:hypothetical protein DPMN_102914, partial [Dreissena polymorpha]